MPATQIRLAAPSDTADIAQQLAMADGMGLWIRPSNKVIEAGTVASTLLIGLRNGTSEMLRPLAEAAAAGWPEDLCLPWC